MSSANTPVQPPRPGREGEQASPSAAGPETTSALGEVVLQISDLQRLQDLRARLIGEFELPAILDEILKTATDFVGTDQGLLSLRDRQSGNLRVESAHGFSPDVLRSIASVQAESGACDGSYRDKCQVVVEDSETDSRCQSLRAVYRSANIRAVYCTPLSTCTGDVIGVLAVHFRRAHQPSPRDRYLIDQCARLAVSFIETDRHSAELREADRRKDEFIATLAHELRNPLAPLSNALQILGMTEKHSPAIEGVRTIMERQVKHLIRVVDDLLEVSRITRGKFDLRREPTLLATIVESAVETSRPLLSDAGHQLTLNFPAQPLTVNADPMRMAQVISNLLNNAAKYTDEGGQVSLTVRQEGPVAVISVRDNGMGIPGEMLPGIFDMFLRTDRMRRRGHGGLGIGLTLAQRLVHMHDATIEVHSAGVGHGSEFTIRLPLMMEPPTIAPPVPRHAALPSRKIVVVDDTRAAAHVLSKLLQAMGQQVQTANDVATAFQLIVQDRPHIVISDIAMPEVDGYELARRVRRDETLGSLILVALTGYGQERDRQLTKEAGFDFHLVKPVSLDALQNLLESLPVTSIDTV